MVVSKPKECTTLKMHPNVNYGLRLIIICQCRLISYNKYTTLVQDVNNGGSCVHVEAGDIRELFILSAQFCCNPKTNLKNKVYFLKWGKKSQDEELKVWTWRQQGALKLLSRK